MSEKNTDWGKSVAGVVIKDGRVLLARHTYGAGKGRLIIPGGYLQKGESPETALQREFMEETGIEGKAIGLLGVRFNMHDWYVIFLAEYVSVKRVPITTRTARSSGLTSEMRLPTMMFPTFQKSLYKPPQTVL